MSKTTACDPPKRHKMALLTFLGLLFPVHIIPPSLQAVLPDSPLIHVSLSVVIMVGLMSYLIMPLLTRVAGDWLYR
ncbi:hypothetical protein [Congregibacter litoralis]|uniref:Uncharacterized protein n=1 Tax=Congregibacter litoralis KT71 TaxID=314285 RepID=A4A6Y4_9GAMM|nr:hypothetical protein [Congregibacter litoralis]EAQ98053.2 hypothetical protein KT71_02362 [Congregibacter litoralis KT71]